MPTSIPFQFLKYALPLTVALFAASCDSPPRALPGTDVAVPVEEPAIIADSKPADADLTRSVVRLRSTTQGWNPGQPWEKSEPQQRRALAAIVAPQRALTTAEMVANATFLEFESPDGVRYAEARVVAIDYEANLALLAPVDPDGDGAALFADSIPLALAEPPALGDRLDVLQIEDTGLPLITTGFLQTIGVTSNFLPGQSFLTFFIKASMQSAAGSFSLPVLHDGRLAGMLLGYNSNEQIIDSAATEIIARFLSAAATAEAEGTAYQGFPGLGVVIARAEDPSFRAWLSLNEDQGGVYLSAVRPGSAAEAAGLKKGDVILAVDDHAIDRRGFYQHPVYGGVFWGHIVRGEKAVGDEVRISILREGEPLEATATLTREEENDRLVPNYRFEQPPNFLVKGGMVFQELSRPLLEAFGREWQQRAPLNLLDAFENPEKYEEDVRRIVFLSGTIPSQATIGYEGLRNLILRRVNGRDILDIATLIEAFEYPQNGMHSIEFADEDFTIHLDEAAATAIDSMLLQRGLPRLSHAGE
jgi:S1-C subfamily serine protease